MVEAFIRERGVTLCPPHRIQHSGPSASGHESPDSFLFRESAAPRTPEQKLAAAKILTMVQDLCGSPYCASSERFKVQQAARQWFFGRSDFELWCDTAGMNPTVVRERVTRILEEGKPDWRAKAGTGKRYAKQRVYRQRLQSRGHQ